jgi:pyrroloquinoline quinone biosynthesis protein E
MVLCFVLHRRNEDQVEQILELSYSLQADYVELASTQYYGWAMLNREQLMPTREQVESAEAVAHRYQDKYRGEMKIFYVVPDYHENRPKACMNGWGSLFLTIAPDGTALPCHAASELPGLSFPNVRDHSVEWIWNDSPDFNMFRGFEWMKEPCRSCPDKSKDFGGCRCQAYLLTGDARNADPVCDKSPHHHQFADLIQAQMTRKENEITPIVFRNMRNSKKQRGEEKQDN